MSTPRGIRNNNPGNIRWSSSNWKGSLAKEASSDKSFVVFRSPEYGIRAIVRILRNYTKRPGIKGVGGPGIDTIREIISRWAPSNENDTLAYILAVAKAVNVATDEHIDVFDNQIMLRMVKAIIQHENGQQPYSDEQIQAGINLT